MRIGNWKFFEHRTIDKESPLGPLVERYIFFRHPKIFGIFIHKLCRSDHDRALHDHPWGFVSVVLNGGYREEHFVENRVVSYADGDPERKYPVTAYRRNHFLAVLFRPATWRHRVIIDSKPAWTLVFVGPRRRRWGFWIPQWDGQTTWCWWAKYNPFKGICSEDELYDTDGDE